jgi:hypothetical protein
MTLQKILYSLLISFVLSPLLLAQGLTNHIPAYAQYVITLNAQSYTAKADMNAISQMAFFNPSNDSASGPSQRILNSIFCKPADCGVKLLPRAYMFRIDNDSLTGWCCVFSIKDPAMFGKFLQRELQEKNKALPAIITSGGYSRLNGGKINVAWTPDFAMLLLMDANQSYSYYDDYSELKTTAYNQAQQDSIQAYEMAKAQALSDSILAAEAAAVKKAQEDSKDSKKQKQKNKSTTSKQPSDQKLKVEEAASDSNGVDGPVAPYEGGVADSYGNEDWEKKEKERQERKEKIWSERADRRLGMFINLEAGKSVSSLRSFSESQKEIFDIAIWMNYSAEAFQGLNPYANRRRLGMTPSSADTANSLIKLLKDNYSVAYCNFNAGKVSLINKAYVNPEMDNLISGIYRKKGNKNFCKYIKGENLMGYASMSVNSEQLIKATRSILIKTYESTMGKEAKYITGMMDIASIFTNDDVAYNLFKGDFVVAVTDLRPFKTSYLSYSYDDNFNRSETKQEKTEILPEFVAMASVGKPDEMGKILKAVEKMGGLRAEGAGTYLVEMPGQAGYKLYIALENNILFCTNNEDLIHGKLKDGYPKSEQMSKEQKELLTSNPIAYYWNGTKTFDLVNKQPDLKTGEKMTKDLNLFKDNLKEARLSGIKKEGNAYVTDFQMDFRDSSVNSLLNICKIVNGFYLLDK